MKIYRRVVRLLKDKLPLPMPVKIRRTKLPSTLDGDCRRNASHFAIRISNTLEEHEAIETLLHEYAHAMSWDSGGDDHSDDWGKAYSRVYRLFVKEILS